MTGQDYGKVFDNVADALLIHCPNSGKILDANDRFCELSGYAKADIVEEPVDRIVSGDELYEQSVDPAVLDRMRGGEPLLTEWELETRDGDRVPVQVHVTLVELDGNERALSSLRDISARRESERQLRRFRRAIEAAGHAVYITDTDGTIEYVNPAFEEITGYEGSEAIGETPTILDSGEHGETYFEDLWSTILDGEVWNEKITNRTKSGDHYHARQTVAPLLDADDDLEGFVAIQTDITEQEHQAKRFRALIENAMAVITVLDDDGRIRFASPSVERFLGLDPDVMEGADLESYVHPEDRESVSDWLQRVRDSPGEPVRNVARFRRENGSWRVFESIANNQLDNPAVEGIIVNSRDITGREERERQLRVLDRLLRHNLRNDMNVVLGMAEQIVATGTAETRTAAERIISTAQRLMETAEKEREVVDIVSKRPQRETFDVVPRVRSGVAGALETRDADVTVDLPQTATVRALPEIEQVVTEIVENAIVHATAELPPVTVTATVAEEWVDLRIRDDGPPIPDEEIEVLTATDIDALNHGSGIGLWLVNWVVSRSEGQLFFERREAGNVVTVRLPRPE